MNDFYAHTAPAHSPDLPWQLLSCHLANVAAMAEKFAREAKTDDTKFYEIASSVGLLHDLGKYRTEFQQYLRNEIPKGKNTRHATYGAIASVQNFKNYYGLFSILGHHSGLPNRDRIPDKVKIDDADCISTLIQKVQQDISHLNLTPFSLSEPKNESEKLTIEVAIRMIFSCLVDADWLDTSAYMQGIQFKQNNLNPSLMIQKLDAYVQQLSSSAPKTNLTAIRERIYHSAIESANLSTGFFSMTVPTGGGKTLSSMAFALHHAQQHGLKRIIVVIPYLSIIEQNANVYRSIFGNDVVVEHHSSIEPPDDTSETGAYSQFRLSTENWNGQIIITTTVQLIESLFSSKPSRCRKLHNIAQSVLILDECQTLPSHLLQPTLSVFRELVNHYGVSILLCSATQPGFSHPSIQGGLRSDEVREIAPNPKQLFQQLKRVAYKIPQQDARISWSDLSTQVINQKQALVVMNTRAQAYQLFEALKEITPEAERDSLFHLSSAMTAQHRSDFLGGLNDESNNTIRGRLKRGLPCRVISTQLVEAGVDVDFPIVYRAIGPLDSIVQAAGRCNREGRLSDNGTVQVFYPDAEPMTPGGTYRIATDSTINFLHQISANQLADDPSIFERYFDVFYSRIYLDYTHEGESTIQEDRINWNFEDVSRKAVVIEKNTKSLIVAYQESKQIIQYIRKKGFTTQSDLRRLQRYSISAQKHDFEKLTTLGAIENLLPHIEIPVLADGFYHNQYGLLIEKRPMEEFIV